MTSKELMEWYQEWWKKHNPDYTKCELAASLEDELFLHVSKPGWKSPRNMFTEDAQKAYDEYVAGTKGFNIDIELPVKKGKKQKKEFKTVACCVDTYTYDQVKKLCKKYEISMHELLKNLLNQAIKKGLK